MSLPIVDTPIASRVTLPEPREARWDRALEPALLAAPGTAPLIERLRHPGALVVTTGQQPGLFTGPSYAVTKALSARAVAQELEQRWGRPVVPIYWIPGDDHDLREAGTVSWLDADGGLRTAALPTRPPEAPMTPMWREALGPPVLPLLDAFEASFPPGSADSIVGWLRRHYRPDISVAGAYGAALAELLAPLGILCLDATHPALKRAAAPLLLQAIERTAELDAALAQRAKALATEGLEAGVPVGDGASLVLLDGPLGRDRLVREGTGYQLRRARLAITASELERIAATEPTRLSANVLLRPVLESALLPTVAYIAGPGELRYLALAAPLYDALAVPSQLPVPRWSGLLLEPRVERVLAKFRTTIPDLLAEGRALEDRIVLGSLPEGTEAALGALREAINHGYEPVIRAATEVDPTLERPSAAARAQALFSVERLEKKLLQHARKREAIELGQIARARASVRPDGKPQERVLSLSGFLARYGPDLLGSVATHIVGWYRHAAAPESSVPLKAL